MKYTDELQLSQIKELVYLECKLKGVRLASDEDLMDNVIEGGAEMIINYLGKCNNPSEVIATIDDWIEETKKNYPSYFTTGEDK